jgi:serine/threonine protein kinase
MGHQLTIADDSMTSDLQPAAREHPSVSIDDQPPSQPGEIGRVLRDRYVLVDRLGSSGRGSVFKALDRYRADLPEAQQYVAIKILRATVANREELLANLRREFYRMQMLSHRNIVNVFELDRDGDVDFFTMEFLEGDLLSRVMGRLQPLPMSRPHAWAIIGQIGSGLEYAHARNVVHADLKPHNIMITDSGEVRILDFGASSTSAEQSPEDHLRPRNTFSSVTSAYACCELLDGRPPDPRDDIYAFACLSYELLTGAHPFQRRRSTEARDFGIVPRRPVGLSRQQWRALTMGLSWHRAGRSISVRAWLDKLNTGRAAGPLPRAHDLESAPANLRPAMSFKATALFAALLICVTVWVSVAGLARRKISTNDIVPAVAAGAQLNTGPVPTLEGAGLLAASVAMDAAPLSPAALNTPSPTSETPSQVVNNTRRDVNRPKLPTALTSSLVVSAGNYTVRSGERFAEIRVHRSSRLGSDTPFVWWTEAASAKPGIDYVHQGKAIQSFPKGKSSTSFFVKLVPKASRTQPEVFYIAIAAAGRGALSDQVARAAVWLPSALPNRGAPAAMENGQDDDAADFGPKVDAKRESLGNDTANILVNR